MLAKAASLLAKAEDLGAPPGMINWARPAAMLAHLRMPAVVETSQRDYVLHPSVMDSALQAAIGLIVDGPRVPDRPIVPFALESLRTMAPCEREMTAWVRCSDGSSPGDQILEFDIDLCDRQGRVCAQMQRLAFRSMDADTGESPAFDQDFYARLLDDLLNRDVSVDESVELG